MTVPALVRADWLISRLDDPGVRIADATWHLPAAGRTGIEDYRRGHVPGAVFWDIDEIADAGSPLPHMLPDDDAFAAHMARLGISDRHHVVVYDDVGTMTAPRAWWTLRAFGHGRVSVLDGGMAAWRAAGHPVSREEPRAETSGWRPRLDRSMVRALPDVRAAAAGGAARLIDARPAARFAGRAPEPRPGCRRGHVPGSLSLPFDQLIDGGTGLFLEPGRIAEKFAAAGLEDGRPVIASCGSGVTACVLALGLHLLGRDDVAVYDGSWAEWGGRGDTPVETGPSRAYGAGPLPEPARNAMKEDTRIVHEGRDPAANHGIINPPVYHASTIAWGSVKEMRRRRDSRWEPGVYTYGRHGTPTHEALEEAFAAVCGGHRSVAVSSGLAAINAALLAFLAQGDHVLMVDSAYGPARHFCDKVLARFGVETTYYDPAIGAGIAGMLRDETRIVYVEAPGSLTFEMQDIPAIAAAARAAGCVVIMDDTWSAGVYFKPFEHGVDVCAMAATKYVVGHSDAMMGLVTATEECWDRVRPSAAVLGANSGPDDVYLALRGLRTIKVRLARHQETGLALARWLQRRPEVDRVLHPALPESPGHALWKRDFTGASGLFSFVLKEGFAEERIEAMLDGMRLFAMGASWGGYESLIIPADPAPSRTATAWTGPGQLIRVHAGLEDPDDLIADLDAGLGRLDGRG